MAVEKGDDEKRTFTVHLFTDTTEDLIFHWSVGRKSIGEWTAPEKEMWPADSVDKTGSVQTPFVKDTDYPMFKSIKIKMPADKLGIKSINYVLFQPKAVLHPLNDDVFV